MYYFCGHLHFEYFRLSDPDQTFVDENTWLKKDFLPISHQYIIQNSGPSPLEELVLQFLIPHKLGDSNEELIKIAVPDVSKESILYFQRHCLNHMK